MIYQLNCHFLDKLTFNCWFKDSLCLAECRENVATLHVIRIILNSLIDVMRDILHNIVYVKTELLGPGAPNAIAKLRCCNIALATECECADRYYNLSAHERTVASAILRPRNFATSQYSDSVWCILPLNHYTPHMSSFCITRTRNICLQIYLFKCTTTFFLNMVKHVVQSRCPDTEVGPWHCKQTKASEGILQTLMVWIISNKNFNMKFCLCKHLHQFVISMHCVCMQLAILKSWRFVLVTWAW